MEDATASTSVSRDEKLEFKLNTPGTRRFMDAYAKAMDCLAEAGYPRFMGTPVGYLFDIPEISKEISQIVDKVSREKPGRPWYESMVHLAPDGVITLTVTFPKKGQTARV